MAWGCKLYVTWLESLETPQGVPPYRLLRAITTPRPAETNLHVEGSQGALALLWGPGYRAHRRRWGDGWCARAPLEGCPAPLPTVTARPPRRGRSGPPQQTHT